MVKIERKRIDKNSKKDKGSKRRKAEEKRIEFSSKELRVNLEQLQKDVRQAYKSMTRILPESVKDAEIKPFGNAAHIILPKEYAGKRATVIIKKKF